MKRFIAVAMAMVAFPSTGRATPAEDHWRELARIDADAAIALVEQNHPGAVTELGDRDFQARLARARSLSRDMLPEVRTVEGHGALLLAIANAFGDGHIWTRALLTRPAVDWPGIVAARRGGKWVVGAQETGDGEGDLVGAEILSCDGISAAAMGRDRIGRFQANADVEADLSGKAYQLLLDAGNPFLKRPVNCRFALAGKPPVDLPLRWRTSPMRIVEPLVVKALRPAKAGLGVSDFSGGKWIELGTLGMPAEGVAAEVERRRDELRAAPMVVVDLRGNGGGDSGYAERIARSLVGDQRFAAIRMKASECVGAFWRASPGNLAELRKAAASRTGESAGYLGGLADGMEQSLTQGSTFAPALPACAAHQQPIRSVPLRLPASAMKGQLILLTDRACFSSCLIATDVFRRLGATHVGEATDRSTRYMEVREVTLPSGLRTFSTLQKVAVGLGGYGPFVPAIAYPGPLDDGDAVRGWIASRFSR